MASNIYLGLVHYPIYNKNGEVITTAITNFDIHDIARTARTYGVQKYFVIHPLQSQADLTREIISYWQTGFGSKYNPDRCEAFKILEIMPTIDEVIQVIRERENEDPLVVTTDARIFSNTISYKQLRNVLNTQNKPCLLLFGTGWGIEKSVMAKFDHILEPIYGPSNYNHLPVRSAVAIILDRLLGEQWWGQ